MACKDCPKKRKELTRYEEFEIMKMILDKFLWLGTFVFAFAIYRLVSVPSETNTNYFLLVIGTIIMLIFVWFLHEEFEHLH